MCIRDRLYISGLPMSVLHIIIQFIHSIIDYLICFPADILYRLPICLTGAEPHNLKSMILTSPVIDVGAHFLFPVMNRLVALIVIV